MRSAALAFALALATTSCGKKPAPPAPTADAASAVTTIAAADDVASWRAALALIATELPKRHPAPFHQTSAPTFQAAVDALAQGLPGQSRDQRIVGLARIVALVADGHTQLDLGPLGRAAIYPVTFDWFSDGLFVTDADPPHRWAVGARLVSVGDRTVDDATAALSATVGWQADGYRRAQVAWRLAWPTFLRGTDLAPADGPAHFGVVDASGATRDLALEPIAWRGQSPAPDTLPLYRQKPRAFYWSRYLPAERTLYVQYNQCKDAPDLSFADFTVSIGTVLDTSQVDRLVIDLRLNGGGNSTVMQPLLDAIGARPALAGRVFALIGRYTFSSALMNAIALDQVGATLVGEPAGSPADHYGEVKRFELPGTGLSVQHATRHFRFRGYPGPALAPEVPVAVSSTEYFAGADPVLAAALAQPVPPR